MLLCKLSTHIEKERVCIVEMIASYTEKVLPTSTSERGVLSRISSVLGTSTDLLSWQGPTLFWLSGRIYHLFRDMCLIIRSSANLGNALDAILISYLLTPYVQYYATAQQVSHWQQLVP